MANRLLPLPKLLGHTLPWRLSEGALCQPLELHELTVAEHVTKLDRAKLISYQDAIRASLRSALVEGTLPTEVLDSHVRACEISEIQADLRSRRLAEIDTATPLTIRLALPFIGRRVNRLLQCLDSSLDVPRRNVALDEWVDIPVSVKSQAKTAETRVLNVQDSNAHRRNSRLAPMVPPKKWHNKREAAPSAVRIALGDGADLTARDVRFGWALLRVHSFLALNGESLEVVSSRVEQRGDPGLSLSWGWLTDKLREANQLTVAEECQALIDALVPRAEDTGNTSSILGPRYGLGGTETTLQEAGDAVGMTRERIRQLQAAFENRVEQGEVYAPRLKQLVHQLDSIRFASMDSIVRTVSPLLGNQAVTGALAFASALGLTTKGTTFDVTVFGTSKLETNGWTTRLNESHVAAILRSARAMTSRVGAFHLTAVMGDVSDDMSYAFEKDEVRAVLDGCKQCVWLDSEIGWGTISGVADFPVLIEVRRMLAVAFPLSLDITDIFAGLTQCRRQAINRSPASSRFGGGMPPPWIVRKLLELQEEFVVAQYDNFKLRKYIDPLLLMEGDTEKRIFEGLRDLGGIASWRQMSNAMVATRILNPITFAVYLKTCSYIYQPAYGIYAFRGQRMYIQSVWKDGQQHEFSLPVSGLGGRVVTEHSENVISFEVNQTTSTQGRGRAVYAPARSASRTMGTFLSEVDPGLRIRIQPSGQIGRLADELESAGVPPKGKILLTLDLLNRSYRWELCG